MTATTLPQLLDQLVHAAGARPFLHCGRETLTGEAFASRAQTLATALMVRGVKEGDRVVFHLEHRIDAAAGVFAAALCGAVSVVLNPRLKDAQVAHVVHDCGAQAVVTSRDKLASLRDPRIAYHGVTPLVLGEDTQVGSTLSPRTVNADAPAMILYTSGSTGMPKGIVQSHRNLVDGARIVAGYLSLTEQDHLVGVLPLSFDYGLNQLLSAAYVGAQLTLHQYLAPIEVFDVIHLRGGTVLAGVPSLWHGFADLLRRGRVEADRVRTLRCITNSGGRLALQDIELLRERLPWVLTYSMYGLTEAFRSTYLPPEEIERRPDSIGRAIPEVELSVVDPATGQRCAPGVEGELVHGGALVALGYWNRPEDTARVFRPDPARPGRFLVYTGDFVVQDEDGYLRFVGRRDGLLKVQGHRVAPDEIEQALRRIEGVQEAAVFGIPDPAIGDRVLAVIRSEEPDLPTRVARQLQRELPSFQLPAAIHRLDKMPYNDNGKIDYAALRERFATRES